MRALVIAALVAGPPSPLKLAAPLPAKVVITPAGVMRRTRLLSVSVTYKLPRASKAKALGKFSWALVAGPPSPPKPAAPVPAKVETIPAGVTRRMRFEARSVINKLPAASNAMPVGWFSCALVACPPSPLEPAIPLPAKVLMMPVAVVTLRMR